MSSCRKKCQTVAEGIYYRPCITGSHEIPVRLPHKKAHARKINKDPLSVGIKQIVPIGIDNYYGFTVDGNHLFLLGDFTVVHNSSLPEIIVYTLFGKTIKKPKKIAHKDVINNQSGKKLYTEVIWDKYRVVRTRKPDTLQLWESEDGIWSEETEITLGGMPATQKAIEAKLGLSYEAFVNVVVFTDDNNSAFLECDTPEKRQIVDNLLSLEKYRDYSDNAKRLHKETKNKVTVLAKEYELLLHDKNSCASRVVKIEQQQQEWKAARLQELNQLAFLVQTKKAELEKSDEGKALLAWQDAQEKLKVLNTDLPTLEEKQDKVRKQIDAAKESYHGFLQKDGILEAEIRQTQENIRSLQRENEETRNDISERNNASGKQCRHCYGQIDKKNYQHILEHGQQKIAENEVVISDNQQVLKEKNAELVKHRELIAKLKEGINAATDKLTRLQEKIREVRHDIAKYGQVREPRADSAALLLEQQISDLKKQAVAKKTEMEGPGPYVEILESVKTDLLDREKTCAAKEIEIKECEKGLPYYEYWITAFGDNGIRKFVIDGIVPALNTRIEYWLQFLIDNKIELKFDNQLEELIQRCPADGSPFIYHVLSNGQRRRLNLSVSQAFAYVMMLNCGASPSFVFLDEVTTNIDQQGVVGIYNMICELAKEKQVFVTTHDHDLLSLLHGCSTINLKMENGITTLA